MLWSGLCASGRASLAEDPAWLSNNLNDSVTLVKLRQCSHCDDMSGITTGMGVMIGGAERGLNLGTAIPSSATSFKAKPNGRPTRAGRIPEQF